MARKMDHPFEHEKDSTGDKIQGHLVAASGEFVGTFFFLYMAFAAHLMIVNQAPNEGPKGGNSSMTIIYISFAYGFSLLINVWIFYRISGGLFNPAVSGQQTSLSPISVVVEHNLELQIPVLIAIRSLARVLIHPGVQVTLGMVLSGALPPIRGAVLLPAQLIASMVAGGLVSCMFPFDIRGVNTTLAPGVSIAQGVFIEMFLTCELIFAVLMLAAEKSKDTFIAPIGIGLALLVAEFAGKPYDSCNTS